LEVWLESLTQPSPKSKPDQESENAQKTAKNHMQNEDSKPCSDKINQEKMKKVIDELPKKRDSSCGQWQIAPYNKRA